MKWEIRRERRLDRDRGNSAISEISETVSHKVERGKSKHCSWATKVWRINTGYTRFLTGRKIQLVFLSHFFSAFPLNSDIYFQLKCSDDIPT